MKRLTARANDGKAYYLEQNKTKACEKLAEYEDAEENGLSVKFPCKIGTHIYIINRHWIDEGYICGLAECDSLDCVCFKVYIDPDYYETIAISEFNETWFLTEDEAKQKLTENN